MATVKPPCGLLLPYHGMGLLNVLAIMVPATCCATLIVNSSITDGFTPSLAVTLAK